jgi:hypothetical protein
MRQLLLAFTLFCSLISTVWAGSEAIPHPFLLVSRADYDSGYATLKARASNEPWTGMKQGAITAALASTSVSSTAPAVTGARMSELMETLALAYVLDDNTTNRATYKSRFLFYVEQWKRGKANNLSDFYLTQAKKTDWGSVTPTGNGFFQTVLALDVIYNDLTPTERSNVETWLEGGPGSFYTQNNTNWPASAFAARGVWALYKQDRTVINDTKAKYLEELLTFIGEDGVFNEGTGYALARFGTPDRAHKFLFADVLVFTGEWSRSQWYDNAQFRNFHEYLYGYSFSPTGEQWGIGDSGAGSSTFGTFRFGAQRASMFSTIAGKYERKVSTSADMRRGKFSAYMLTTNPRPTALSSISRLFPDGGAYYREAAGSSEDVASVLVNTKSARGHTHKEVNSIHMSAYGKLTMTGTGYNGWSNSWTSGSRTFS